MINRTHILTQFGKRIRDLRNEHHLSQEALGELCGLDRTYISSLENGKRNVSLQNIAALAASLGITLSQLFEGINFDEKDIHP